jgi:hypothetical protein
MRGFLLAAVFGLAGCGAAAESSRLKSGQEATLFAAGGSTVDVGENRVAMGTRVVVVSDDEGTTDDNTMRGVKVNVMEGPHSGTSGTVLRSNLRPK